MKIFLDCGTAEWTPYDEAGNDEWICSSGEYAINGFSSTDDTDWLISDFTIDFSAYASVKIDVTTQERYGDNINTPGEFELLYSMDYSGGDPTLQLGQHFHLIQTTQNLVEAYLLLL